LCERSGFRRQLGGILSERIVAVTTSAEGSALEGEEDGKLEERGSRARRLCGAVITEAGTHPKVAA